MKTLTYYLITISKRKQILKNNFVNFNNKVRIYVVKM